MGEFEELVLLAVYALDKSAYAVSVQQRIEQVAQRKASMGAVYAALDRLEQKGFAESWLGKPTPQRGGRPKRFYRITGAGQAALQEMRLARERMWDGLDLNPKLGGA